MADMHVSAECGCFFVGLEGAGTSLAMCPSHRRRFDVVFDQGDPQPVEALLSAYSA
jgi:hypothetical protein